MGEDKENILVMNSHPLVETPNVSEERRDNVIIKNVSTFLLTRQ
jgi:hypothetical protein